MAVVSTGTLSAAASSHQAGVSIGISVQPSGHLLSVLERITKLAGREIQRIGLSATVGNPDTLIDWLAGSCRGERRVFVPPATAAAEAEVKLDYVGSLHNAAVVISRLHRGEKRLVFIDSRARAEELGMELRQLGITAFVTHSSLSQEQRHQAEDAFANREDCVIVATSVLELGIDVGNLDRVIQIDSPATVSSFLQRMGRTGRRPGTMRNCLFLATHDETLVQAAGLIDLWAEGYIESIEPPAEPYHILAQQLMALTLQERGVGRRTWLEWIRGVPAFREMAVERIEQIVGWMLERGILWEDEGILSIGKQGEDDYGRKHFLELFSVFMSPPLFSVLHGRQELGFVDELTFLGKQEGPRILLLGGRSWRVTHVDWQRKTAYVEAAEGPGKSRWAGTGPGLRLRLCQAIQQVLASDGMSGRWSQRAQERVAKTREDFAWLTDDASAVALNSQGQVEWWTFAGHRANAMLLPALSRATHSSLTHDSFTLRFAQGVSLANVEQAILGLRSNAVVDLLPVVDEHSIEGLKFADCLPVQLALHVLQMRMREETGVEHVLDAPIRYVTT